MRQTERLFREKLKVEARQIQTLRAQAMLTGQDRDLAEMLVRELIFIASSHGAASDKDIRYRGGIYLLATAIQDALRPRASKRGILDRVLGAMKALDLLP